MSDEQKHQYHLVEPSPWPALGSAAGFTLFLGLTLFMHEYPYSIWVLGAGLFMVLATMFYWWRDIVREAEYQGHHTPIVQIGCLLYTSPSPRDRFLSRMPSSA